MKSISFKSGLSTPAIGFGTWRFGGSSGFHHDKNNDDTSQINTIQYAVNSGLSLIRTAQNYADGYCETLVGEAVKKIPRENYQLMVATNEHFVHSVEDLVKQAEGSLKRLGQKYIDMYLVGGLDIEVPISVIAKGLLKVKKLGIAKNIGIGNYRLTELKVLHEYLGEDLIYNEVHTNLVIREHL